MAVPQKHTRLHNSQAIKVYMTSWAKEKWVGGWDFRGESQFTRRYKQPMSSK